MPPGTAPRPEPTRVPDRDAHLLAALRAGDEAAFAALVTRYHASLKRVARAYVSTDAVAEEVVQDTWLAVVRGIGRFEERSTLKAWIFQICANRARTTGRRERRSIPIGAEEPAVDPRRFAASGAWATPPTPWADEVEDRLTAAGAADAVRGAIAALPDGQKQVVTLRDVEGLSSEEVCAVLDLTAVNQRVLLHRGRSRVRRALEQAVSDR
jgi:RNA polymerase sigma-70 factor (ECF subfamily)